MKQQAILAAMAVLALSATAQNQAWAEPVRLAQAFIEPGGVPPYEVITIARSAGFDPLGQPFRRGPNYVLRAIGQDDQEVRVVVNARRGEIVRVVPIETASRMPPGGGSMGPYERMEPEPRYLPPRGAYRGGPPVAEEDDEPMMDGDPRAPRPPGAVPGAPPPRAAYGNRPPEVSAMPPRGGDISRSDLPPPSGSRIVTAAPPASGPRVITATEPDRNGVLPPPPERFPQRALPPSAAKPKPMKPSVASIPKQAHPKPAPLPKPRPAKNAAASAAPGAADPIPQQAPAPAAAPQPPAEAAAPSAPAAGHAPAAKPDASKALPN